LKSKKGELEALAHMSAAEAAAVQPVVEILSTVAKYGDVVRRLADAAVLLGSHGRHLMLEVSRLHPSSRLWRREGGPHLQVRQALEDQLWLHSGALPPFVPVVPLDAEEKRVRQVALLLGEGEPHVAVRVPVREPQPALALRLDRAVELLRGRSMSCWTWDTSPNHCARTPFARSPRT
jgi:hypothetical protein